jgi:hypothetical protein
MSVTTIGFAMPYCALRDPAHQLYDMFPVAKSYRSIVRAVDEKTRLAIGSELPFTLHSRELGQHTLYIPLDNQHPLGIVHVRSEASDWGLVEIAWAFDMQLRVRDFRFQRCRGTGCETLSNGPFIAAVRGRNLAQVKELLAMKDSELARAIPGLDALEYPLAETVLRSAAKTLAVTERVWGDDIAHLR